MRAPRPLRVFSLAISVLALTGLAAAPASAATASGDTRSSGSVGAAQTADCASSPTVNEFSFRSFDAVYVLGRDGSGRSTLHTTETLVADFPDFDQNRGIRRDLVSSYQGHDTGLRIVSVTDGDGNPRSYETETSTDANGETRLSLTIARPCGQYEHGVTTYVIEYTQQDVTFRPDNLDSDEFYWDTNGDGWAQPFDRVSATVEVSRDLQSSLSSSIDPSCYVGSGGSTDQCSIAYEDGTFHASATDLSPYENVTVAIDFDRNTFAGAPWWSYVPIVGVIGIALALFGAVFGLITRFVIWRNARGTGIVIAQYEPPAGLSALVAANIVGAPRKGMAASVVDLAVRKNVRILEHDQGWSKVFGVQRLTDAGLDPDEQRVMGALFAINPFSMGSIIPGLRLMVSMGGQAAPAASADPNTADVRWLTKGDTILGQQVVALTKAVAREVEAGGLRRKPPGWPFAVTLLSFILSGVLLIWLTFTGDGTATNTVIGVVGLNAVPWLAVLTLGAMGRTRPLTEKGAALKEHLDGLKEYIRLAEADRLRMLQSVSGAERITTTDGAAIVKIYERLLPYAVLFGLEKQWANEIAKYYDTTPPDWYSGSGSFNAGLFAAGIGSLSSSVSTSFSGSPSSSGSSSSGGGGGGGSSGGGGGGGGGGGV